VKVLRRTEHEDSDIQAELDKGRIVNILFDSNHSKLDYQLKLAVKAHSVHDLH